MLKILELFGGIGSPRIALQNIGIPVKAIDYVEIDEKAVRSYNAMFASELPYKTQNVCGWNLKPDILIHGSPCQDFSIAGHQKGADEGSETRSSLMWETLNIIEQMGIWKPRIVIWENVKGVISQHMIHNFNQYLYRMEELGYTNSHATLNAMDFGLPQQRKRVFTVSFINGEQFDFGRMKRTPAPHISEFLQPNDEVPDEYLVTAPSMVAAIGKKNTPRRASIIDSFCYTITERQDRAPNSGVVDLGNGQYRYLTPLECWRLQGYSDTEYYAAEKVTNSKRELWKQSGNSIPVTIFESMFKVILGKEGIK
ncbi:MAG: DNA cytosine methyltransferase [Candidatus Cloacimonetes bacterium]|nr:DNA cytosine methyltransferase [Candidatus Cloacimonadota bacterium]